MVDLDEIKTIIPGKHEEARTVVLWSTQLAALVAELEEARSRIDQPLNIVRKSSCGHTWAVRRAACPECFSSMQAELEEARVRLSRWEDVVKERVLEVLMDAAAAFNADNRYGDSDECQELAAILRRYVERGGGE